MKTCSRALLDLVSSCSPDIFVGKMESDNKITKDPEMKSSGQIQNSRQKTNISSDTRFTSKLIGLVDSLGKSSKENTCSLSYEILKKGIKPSSSRSPFVAKDGACPPRESLLVDTELEKKVLSDKRLFSKLKGDGLDTLNLKAIESECQNAWCTFMPNAQISSKKRKADIFSDCISSKKALCEELNFFSLKRGSVVSKQHSASPHKVPKTAHSQKDCQILKPSGLKTSKTNSAVNSTAQCKIKKTSEKNMSKLFLDTLFVKISKEKLQTMYPNNNEKSQVTSHPLMDPRQDEGRILKRKAEPREVLLKRTKWSMNMASSTHCSSINRKPLEKLNVVKPVHKNTNIQNISSQVSPIRKELVDPRLKHSKIFPSNSMLCDNKQYSSKTEKAEITGFALKQNETLSAKPSVKSNVQVSSGLLTKHPCSNSVTPFTSIPPQVSSSKMSFKTNACASSVTSTKCTYSHPTLPKMKKQGVPEPQIKCTDSHSPTDFTSQSTTASPSELSVKTSVCLPSEMQANCTNELLTSSSDTSVKASLHVSSENQAKRAQDSSILLDEHDVVPKKKAKYSSHRSSLSLNKCDINISSVQTASGSAISVKILEYNNSATGNEINVEVLSQQLQVDETASTIRKNVGGKNKLTVKKSVKNQSSCDISKDKPLSSSATLTSKVQCSDNLLSSSKKKSTTTFSTSKIFNKRKVPKLDKPTSSLKCKKESCRQLHSKQACSEVTSNRKSISKSLCQEIHAVPNKKHHRTSVSNEKLSLPNPKQQGRSKSRSLLKQKEICKINIKSLVGTLKKHFTAQCQTISSCISLNNIASNPILPFDFKVEDFMEEVLCAPMDPQFKSFKLSTIWRKTLCMPLKFAAKLSWESYLNYVCSDSITKPASAKELFEHFLQNRLSMHLIKHSNLGLVGIMKYFALRALKLYKSKIRRMKSNTRNCPNPSTSSTNSILTLDTCLDTSEGLDENSLESHTDNNKHACCKIGSVGKKVEIVDSKEFSISTMWIKKDLEWEMCFQISNLMFCCNLENFKKDSISLLLSKKGISLHILDRSNFLMKSEDMVQKLNACMFRNQFLCNVYSKNEKFLSSVILGAPEGMFLNTYCQELQYSDFVKQKGLKRSNNVSIYKFLCNNYRTLNAFKSMSLNTLCLKSNRLLPKDESFDDASEKCLTFYSLQNEQIYFVKPEMLPSKLSVTYKMCDELCIKQDPKCSKFTLQEISSCKLESDSTGFSQTFDSSCTMKKETTINLYTTDTCKSELGVSYKNNCIVNMEMGTTKSLNSDSENKVIIDPSWVLNDTGLLSQLQEQLAIDTTTLIPKTLQLPASKVNCSIITALNATSVQLLPSQKESCIDFSTSALGDMDLQLPVLKDHMSNGFSTTALNDTNIQVPQVEDNLSNELSTTTLSITNIPVLQSKEQLSTGFSNTVSNDPNVQLLEDHLSNGFSSAALDDTNMQVSQLKEKLPNRLSTTVLQVPQVEENSTNEFSTFSLSITNIPVLQSKEQSSNRLSTTVSNAANIQLPALEDHLSNGFSSTALDYTNVQVPQVEENLSNGFSTTASSVTNMQVPKVEKNLSNEFSTTTLSIINLPVLQTKEQLSKGFSTTVSNAANVQLLEDHLSNGFSSTALDYTNMQVSQLEEKLSNGFPIIASSVTNEQVPKVEENLSNEFSTTTLSITNIQVPQSKERLSNVFSTTASNDANLQLPALQEQSTSDICNTSTKAANIQVHPSEVCSHNSVHITPSNPTCVQLPVLGKKSAKDRNRWTSNTWNFKTKLNDIVLSKASQSQADTNVKSQVLSEDFYSLLDSLSNLLEKNNYTDSTDIDSDESLKNSTESKILSQDESDSSLLDSILDYYESSISNSSGNSQSAQTVPASSNKSLLSLLQEISMPSPAEMNSATELCSSHASLLASSKESSPNFAKLKTCSQAFSQLSKPFSKDNFQLNISQKKIISPKTPETTLLSTSRATLMPAIAKRNIESLHFCDLASSEEATKLFASPKKPNIAPKEISAKTSVTEKYFESSVLPLNPASEPRHASPSPTCETETSLNCDQNSCTGTVTSSVFQTDCHLKAKKLNVSFEILNSAFHDFDLFEEGKPLRRYYTHLMGTGNHVLNLDCIHKDNTELSVEMLESYNFLKGELEYHRCLLRGLIHTASNPDTDCDTQMDGRIANELEYIEGYELACQALLL